MKLLVTGAGGMLGQDVVVLAKSLNHEVTGLDRDDLDITNAERVERRFKRERPAAVINCAAWTDVDGAEDDEGEATRVNGEGAGIVASAAAEVGATVLYPSTDYVFDGSKDGPYVESDEIAPINAYGRSKLAGERATAKATKRSFLVRTAWLFGPGGPNFVETMLRHAADSGRVLVVHDQVGCPTYTGHLAAGLVRLVEGGTAFGIHHMAGAGRASWFEFAEQIFSESGVPCKVMGATSDMLERRAKRPANSVLVSGRQTPIVLPTWERGVSDYFIRRARAKVETQGASA